MMELTKIIESLPEELQGEVMAMAKAGIPEEQILSMLSDYDFSNGFDQVRGTQYALKDRKVVIPPGTSTTTLGTRG